LHSTYIYTNFKLADWPSFIREVGDLLSNEALPTSCTKGKKVFRDVPLQASKHNISGYRMDFIPGLPRTAKVFISERDNLRAQNPTDPEIPFLDSRIEVEIENNKHQKWREEVEALSEMTPLSTGLSLRDSRVRARILPQSSLFSSRERFSPRLLQ
jgi:hypothetical protein